MNKFAAIFIFYVCGAIGVMTIGFGFGSLFSYGIGLIITGICSISLIPAGIWFNNNIVKFLKD